MALEATFHDLLIGLHKLHDSVKALEVTAGDKPEDDGSALADGLGDDIVEMQGWVEECRKAATSARKAVNHPHDLDLARRALTTAQDSFQRMERQFASNLVSYEKLRELARLAGQRQGEWRGWATSMKRGIEECRPALEYVSSGLARCWQEVAEHAGQTSISVKATNIGQKIISRPAAREFDLADERIP
jgi:hypothetical protein